MAGPKPIRILVHCNLEKIGELGLRTVWALILIYRQIGDYEASGSAIVSSLSTRKTTSIFIQLDSTTSFRNIDKWPGNPRVFALERENDSK
jgi:hypothetical protein